MLNDSLYSSDKMDWETPRLLFDDLNNEFKFTLDVCASDKNHKCSKYFTIKEDGLKQVWQGTCWMNPPYGREIAKWVEKAYIESCIIGCKMVVCLLPVRSDTKWWHNYVMEAREIRLLTRRLSFEGSNNKDPFPACIVVFGGKNYKPMFSAMVV